MGRPTSPAVGRPRWRTMSCVVPTLGYKACSGKPQIVRPISKIHKKDKTKFHPGHQSRTTGSATFHEADPVADGALHQQDLEKEI